VCGIETSVASLKNGVPPNQNESKEVQALPGPAGCRLSNGDQTPEAAFELFQDWQRRQTQSAQVSIPFDSHW
jgi:hypothetical protein